MKKIVVILTLGFLMAFSGTSQAYWHGYGRGCGYGHGYVYARGYGYGYGFHGVYGPRPIIRPFYHPVWYPGYWGWDRWHRHVWFRGYWR